MATVFISSTGKDLTDYRQAAIEVCLRLGLTPVAMEFFEAMGIGATEGSKAKLDGADVYVGIFAHRYGYIEDGHDQSVTEIEFDYAGEKKLDRLCFLLDPKHPWPQDAVDHENYPRLKKFKGQINKLVRAEFTTVDSFRAALIQALVEWKKQAGIEGGTGQREAPGGLPEIHNIPHQRNPNFTGRDELLRQLREALGGGESAAITQAIHGLGGVGKTQLALEYAYRYASEYSLIWWLRSEGPESLNADFEALGKKLGVVSEEERSEQSEVVEAVRAELEHRTDWLLVFDNARRPDEIRPYLPRGSAGHVVLTGDVIVNTSALVIRPWGACSVAKPLPVTASAPHRLQMGPALPARRPRRARGPLPSPSPSPPTNRAPGGRAHSRIRGEHPLWGALKIRAVPARKARPASARGVDDRRDSAPGRARPAPEETPPDTALQPASGARRRAQ